MNDVKKFLERFRNEVRTVNYEGELWFVFKDVARVLGYKDTNKARVHCIEEGMTKHSIQNPNGSYTSANIINSRNLIRLISRTTMPISNKIMDWVYDAVVPTVFLTGSYDLFENKDLNETKVEDNTEEDEYIEEEVDIDLDSVCDEPVESTSVAALGALVSLLNSPDTVNNCCDDLNVDISNMLKELLETPAYKDMLLTEFVDHTKYDRTQFYTFLTSNKLVYRDKDSGCFLAYDKYINKGYFKIDSRMYIDTDEDGRHRAKSYRVTLITPKGRAWLKNNYPQLFN